MEKNQLINYFESLGLCVNTTTKARGHQGFFLKDRIDISKNIPENSIVYTGSHDNEPINGWIETAAPQELENAMKYFELKDKSKLRETMMNAALQSKAFVCILTMQDLIGLGIGTRMNTPASVGLNWKWRATENQITPDISKWLKAASKAAGRINEE